MSVVELVTRALDRAERRRELGAFWALDPEAAMRSAAAVDQRAASGGPAGPLAGTPVAVKDLFDQAGLPTTAGLPGREAAARSDAEAVRRLRRAGAVPIGKTAMDPLGCTTGGQAPGFPPCLNPVDASLSPGGSSSGSAVAVAAGIVPLALGSDAAGSSRIPAAYCGVVGMKPVLRSVPRRGCVEVMPGFDTPALLADSVSGCVRGYTALTRREPPGPPPSRPLRMGLLADLLERSDDRVADGCRDVLERLDPAEVEVEDVALGWRPRGFGVALAYELAVTWGEWIDRDPGQFTELIRDTVEFGRRAGAEGHRRALSELSAARDRLRRRLARFDAVACPTVPIPAPAREAESLMVSTSFTRIFNALDWPALSIPLDRAAGAAPIAIQVAGLPSRLGAVLEAARRIESAVEVEPS